MTKVLVLYYSSYGHIETMAAAVAAGARQVDGVEVTVKRVPELVPEEVARKSGMKLDQEALWMNGSLIGKVGSVFASSNTQHGGQETTITSFHTTLLHQGMVIVGLPYSHQGLMVSDEVSGGTPYGATTVAGADGSRTPSDNELDMARFQGRHVAEIAAKLAAR